MGRGNVGGGGRFYHDCKIGLYGISGSSCPPQSDFFLHDKAEIHIIGQLAFQHFDQHQTPETVVNGFGDHSAVFVFKKRFKADRITEGYILLRFFP